MTPLEIFLLGIVIGFVIALLLLRGRNQTHHHHYQ